MHYFEKFVKFALRWKRWGQHTTVA